MKSKNKIIMTILSFIVLSLIILPNLRADIDPDSLKNAQTLADAGIIVNNSKNPENYNLKSGISRREMLKVMLNLAGTKVSNTCEGKFADLPASDWGCKYAETALKLGYIAPNKYFRPDDNVSKTESLKMIFKAKGIEVPKTTDWREGYVQKGVELGYTQHFTDYDAVGKRNFVFNVGAKTIKKIQNSSNNVIVSNVKEEFKTYEKPKMLLTFAKDMNRVTVLSNLKVYPEIKYASNWIDDKNLELVVDEIISKETDILINVLDDATTKSGEKLTETFVKQFKIDGEAIIEFVTPNGKIEDLNQNITVRFSKPMVALTNLDNQAKCPIEITPNISGKCVWITTSTFQFRPEKGFPTGGKYSINIPSGIETISKDKTINSKSFEITTPAFALISDTTEIKKEDKLNFVFNDEVSLESFKSNFSISEFTNDKLKFSYYKGENDLEESTNIISVFPLSGDWGYSKTYNYKISASLTSSRGNIGLASDVSKSLKTNDFLLSYNTFVFLNEKATEKFDTSNMRNANNNNIITQKNPSILFSFYKEVELDKSLFGTSLDFNLNYAKNKDYENDTLMENKKQVVLTFSGAIEDNISIKLNLSKYSSSEDKTLTFNTKENNQIISYEQINYKKACLEVKNPIIYEINKYFEFDKYGKIDYANEVNKYTGDKDCSFENGKNKYILSTKLNPESDYKLVIKNTLLDLDNYPLNKDYSFTFKTGKALNEDKAVSIMDKRNLVLVPNDIKPLSVSLQSVNLKQILAKVCVGDLDILSENYIKDETCVSKTISLNNLGFKPNISIIDLEKVYGKTILKKHITLEVSKISSDKTEYEAKNDYFLEKASFIISDIGATIKSAKNNILWLHNFGSGVNLTDDILKIESYTKKATYSTFGAYKGEKTTFEKNISFFPKADGMYEFNDANFNTLLITLKSGEQIILDNIYGNYYGNENIYTYISTDRPIYKAGDKVNISGISKKLSAKGYNVNSGILEIYIRDSQYKEVLNKQISLNNLGAFEMEFDLKKDASLGNYSIEIGGHNLSFAVEEYEKPDFKVETKSKNDNYLYGETAKIDVLGEYYIGLPLSNGEGKYSLSSSEFYFDGGKTTSYTFGEQRHFWWDYRPMYSSKIGGFSPNYENNGNVEKTEKFVLDSSGKSTVNIDLENSSKDKIYTISTTLTDPNTKKSISTNTTFKAIRSKTFLGIKFDKYYYAFKDKAQIGFVSTDIEGNKVGNESFSFKVYKVDYIYDENTYKYDQKETKVLEKTLKTNESGILSESFDFSNYGEYRFEIENGKYKTTKTIYVSGGDLLRPIDAGNKIELLSDKDIYKIGDKIKVAISSPVKGVKALLTIEKLDEILQYKIIDIDEFSKEIEIDARKEYLPNMTVGVYIIKDIASVKENLEKLKSLRIEMLKIEQDLQKEKNINYIPYLVYDLSIYPQPKNEDLNIDLLTKLASKRLEERELLNKILPSYFVGNKDIKFETDSIKLNSNIKLNKTSYLPGDKQIIELNITDNDGNPISGETTISIIDESLLALKDNKTDIVEYFYSEKANEVNTLGNLANLIKRIEFNVEDNILEKNEDSLKGGLMDEEMSFGMAGNAVTESAAPAPMADMDMMMEKKSMARDGDDGSAQNSNATKLRTEFKDLAFYKTIVKVENGKATLEVPALPDNLTTWVISGFAYTSDQKVGNYENKFKVQKEISLLPQIPRFFLSGDKAQISALVVNNTTGQKEVKVSFDMTNVSIVGEKEKTIQVKENNSALVYFDVEVGSNLETSPQSPLPLEERENVNSTQISMKAKENMSPELSRYPIEDSIKIKKPIYPSKTSEYVFTNGSTKDVSYEEKLDFTGVSKNGGYLEITLGATILTNLTKNLDKVLYFPSDDLSSKLTFLENAMALEYLYKKLEKTSDFEKIILKDYNSKEYKVKEVMTLVKEDIKNFVQSDNGLSYFKDCDKWFYSDTCSNMNITGNFLNLNIEVSGISNKALLEYYKKALIKKIEDAKEYTEYTSITDFFPIALYKETDFVNKYFNPELTLSNLEKLEYIKLYTLLGSVGPKQDEYLKDLKNAILVEARGSVLPAEKSYSPNDNSVASARMIGVLIDTKDGEKLLLENLVRFLISNRDDSGNYYTYDFSEIINAINKYVEFTNELKGVDFSAKTFLNSKEIFSSSFGESNKFNIDKKTFKFEEYLKTGENSLGFEKTGNGKLYYDVGVRYYLPVSKMLSREEGITVSRKYYNYEEYKNAFKKTCINPWWYYDMGSYCITKKVKNIDSISSAKKGDYIVGEIEILLDKERTDVVINDYLPAGAEVLNTNFNTTSSEVKDISGQGNNNNWWYGGFDHIEQKDDRIYLYAKHLQAGSYKYTYVLKANHIGVYNLKPATAELIEKPEIFGRSDGGSFEVK